MKERPPFDGLRAAFWLVAFVVGVYGVVVMASVAACIWHSAMLLADPNLVCDPKDRLSALMAAALAAALAFAGSFITKQRNDDDDDKGGKP